MTNIIFGLFTGFTSLKTSKGGLYYFMKSLRKYNKTCKVIIVVEKQYVFDDLQSFAKEMDFEIYTDFVILYHIVYYRFEIYNKYLLESNTIYNKILLSDVDDVIFQGDPFEIEFNEDLYLACESNILSSDNWASCMNIGWISECNHLENIHYENYIDSNIICAGTILGTYEGIKKYLDFFIEIQKKKHVNDQGLLNVYVYNFLESKSIKPYQESRILTLEGVLFEQLTIENNCILNRHREKYAIIHQINRCNHTFMLSLVH